MNDNEKKKVTEEEDKSNSIKHGFRAYSKIITTSLNLVTTIIMGVLLGYHLDKVYETDYWIVICIFLFAGIAMFNFFREIMKIK